MDSLPRFALSIMQPWAWLIVNGHKNIENRDWPTRFRGPIAIHAGKKMDHEAAIDIQGLTHPVTGELLDIDTFVETGKGLGGIVGVAEIVDCVSASDSDWFVGKFGFVMRNAAPVPFLPVRGALGFFDWRANIAPDTAPKQVAQGRLL